MCLWNFENSNILAMYLLQDLSEFLIFKYSFETLNQDWCQSALLRPSHDTYSVGCTLEKQNLLNVITMENIMSNILRGDMY